MVIIAPVLWTNILLLAINFHYLCRGAVPAELLQYAPPDEEEKLILAPNQASIAPKNRGCSVQPTDWQDNEAALEPRRSKDNGQLGSPNDSAPAHRGPGDRPYPTHWT